MQANKIIPELQDKSNQEQNQILNIYSMEYRRRVNTIQAFKIFHLSLIEYI